MNTSNKKITFKGIWTVLKNAFTAFGDDNVTRISGSLAYTTIFSFAPFLIVILGMLGMFLGQEAVKGELFETLSAYVGKGTAEFIQNLTVNASISGKSKTATIIGIATLVFTATGVFSQIQTALNDIWGIKPKPKKSWLKMILNRLLSFSLIISLGFLFLVFFGINFIIDAFSNRLMASYPEVTKVIFEIINVLLSIGVTVIIFGALFKFLPDAKIKWKDVLVGAFITSLLFMAGRYGIGFYISTSKYETTFGAAASFVILLVWIYYSSLILFFGAEFTKSWANHYGRKIFPTEYAVTKKIVELESDNKPLETINKQTVDTNDVNKKEVDLNKKIQEDFTKKSEDKS